MDTTQELNADYANLEYVKKHGVTLDDLDQVCITAKLLEDGRLNAKEPIIGDIIICTTPDNLDKPNYPNAHLDSPLENEYASICVQPSSAPFVFHDGEKITKFSCSGGYWTAEQEIKMFEYMGQDKKLFCQWGHCGMAHSGAIYFIAKVNVWRLVRENLT